MGGGGNCVHDRFVALDDLFNIGRYTAWANAGDGERRCPFYNEMCVLRTVLGDTVDCGLSAHLVHATSGCAVRPERDSRLTDLNCEPSHQERSDEQHRGHRKQSMRPPSPCQGHLLNRSTVFHHTSGRLPLPLRSSRANYPRSLAFSEHN